MATGARVSTLNPTGEQATRLPDKARQSGTGQIHPMTKEQQAALVAEARAARLAARLGALTDRNDARR
jgi:hypothetical protein